jgi:hypothetical protein
MAADQKEGVNKHNLRGVAIGGHVNGDELVFVHTQGIEEMNEPGGQRRG